MVIPEESRKTAPIPHVLASCKHASHLPLIQPRFVLVLGPLDCLILLLLFCKDLLQPSIPVVVQSRSAFRIEATRSVVAEMLYIYIYIKINFNRFAIEIKGERIGDEGLIVGEF